MARGFRICCLTKNKTNPAYEGARIGAGRLAMQLGIDLIPLTPEVPDDIEEQRAQLQDVLRINPDAALVCPVHTAALDPELSAIRAAGIPLFYFVANSDNVPAETFVTSDNQSIARDVAAYLFEHLGGRGNVAILEGIASSPTSAPRTAGFVEAAASYPGIDVVARRPGNYQREDAREVMSNILDECSDIAGVLAANDFMAFGANDAFDDFSRMRAEAEGHQPRRPAVIGLNAMPDAIAAIRLGRMLATVGYDALTMTCLALHAAHRYLQGKAVPPLIELPGAVVHAGNCDAWAVPFEERPLPDWEMAIRHAKG